MLPRNHPDHIQISFDAPPGGQCWAEPATLAQHLGLPQLVDRRLDLGDAPGRANTGDKISVASALWGRLHRRRLRAGGTGVLGCLVKAPTSCAASVGTCHQLEAASCWRAWAAGAGPGDAADHRPGLLRNLWSGQEGARHHGYTGQRGYHQAGTGEVPA